MIYCALDRQNAVQDIISTSKIRYAVRSLRTEISYCCRKNFNEKKHKIFFITALITSRNDGLHQTLLEVVRSWTVCA